MRCALQRLTVVLMLMASALGCVCEAAAPGRTVDVLISNTKGEENLYLSEVVGSLRSEARRLGFELSLEMLGSDELKAVRTKVRDMGGKATRPLIVLLHNPQAAKTVCEAATLGSVPIIFLIIDPGRQVLGSFEKAWYIGPNRREPGTMQGKQLQDFLNSHPSWDRNGNGMLDYVLLKSEKDQQDSVIRSRSFKNALVRRGIISKAVAEEFSDYGRSAAHSLLKGMLDELGTDNVEAVICTHDVLALGALDALAQYGVKGGSIPVLGVDGITQMIEQIARGEAYATVLQDPQLYAEASLQLLNSLLSGEDFDAAALSLSNDADGVLHLPLIPITQKEALMFVTLDE